MTQVTTGQAAPPGSANNTSIDFPTFSTKNTVYTAVGNFCFAGSNAVGLPTAIQAICGVEDATSLDVRVRDVKNNLTIAEKTGITASFPSIENLGTVNNVSTDVAVWEIQIRRNSGTGNQTISGSSLVLVF